MDFSLHRYSDTELVLFVSKVLVSLTGNVYFTDLEESLTLLAQKQKVFEDYLTKMGDGSRQVTLLKNIARADVETTLQPLALKIELEAQGDMVKLMTTGFALNQSTRTPVGELAQVEGVKIKTGTTPGSLEITWNGVDHAVSYEIRYCLSPLSDASLFVTVTSTKRKVILEGLIPGRTYVVQVAAIGTGSKRIWSVAITSPYVS